MADPKADAPKPDAAAGETGGGGFKAWLPLLLTLVLMPVLAFVTTRFLILPKLIQARDAGVAEGDPAHPQDAASPDDAAKPKDSKDAGSKGKKKQTVPITKLIVNVAGSMGTRYLMTSLTLAGTRADFKTVIEENKDQLLDLANTSLASKTIADLEKPGARNQLRAELISIFNNALGANYVQEIYFTEFAIQ